MKRRLNALPKYSCADTLINARQFNAVRLALRRLSDHIRFPIKGKSHLEVVIDNDSWLVIDHSQNDLPIVAWTQFQSNGRSLHEPVRCQLAYYHFAAAVAAKEGLAALDRYLGIKLERESKKAVVKSIKPTAIAESPKLREVSKA